MTAPVTRGRALLPGSSWAAGRQHSPAGKPLAAPTQLLTPPPRTHTLPPGASYPTRDAEGHLLVTEYGRCRYRDNQMITMQELPETAPPGQLPHSGARTR